MAKRRAAAGPKGPGYRMDGKAQDGVENDTYDYRLLGIQRQTSALPIVSVAPTETFGPVVYLDAFLLPKLIQEDVFPYMWANFREETKMPIAVNASAMSY